MGVYAAMEREEAARRERATEKAEAFRAQHKLDATQWYAVCDCGRWEGYINRYGPRSYAAHLLTEFLLSDGTARDG